MKLMDPDNMGYSFVRIFAIEFLILGLIIGAILIL